MPTFPSLPQFRGIRVVKLQRNFLFLFAAVMLLVIAYGYVGISKSVWYQKLLLERKNKQAMEARIIKKITPLNEIANSSVRVAIGNDDNAALVFEQGSLTQEFAQDYKVETKSYDKIDLGDKLAKFTLSLIPANNNVSNQDALKAEENLGFSSESENQNHAALEYDYSKLNGKYIPETLAFEWLNEKEGRWEKVPTTLDRQNSKVIAYLTHFSEYSLTGEEGQAFAPTLKNWQTDTYTGAATRSIPIENVPGIGGLQPTLNFTYNTSRITPLNYWRGTNTTMRGGWLGAGWDLTLPEIRLNSYVEIDSQENCHDDDPFQGPQFSLILGGTEDEMAWIGYDSTLSTYITKGGIEVKAYYGDYGNQSYYTNPSPACPRIVVFVPRQ